MSGGSVKFSVKEGEPWFCPKCGGGEFTGRDYFGCEEYEHIWKLFWVCNGCGLYFQGDSKEWFIKHIIPKGINPMSPTEEQQKAIREKNKQIKQLKLTILNRAKMNVLKIAKHYKHKVMDDYKWFPADKSIYDIALNDLPGLTYIEVCSDEHEHILRACIQLLAEGKLEARSKGIDIYYRYKETDNV